ncbi:putative ADP-ribosylation factor GTPase-activating protein AGD5 [Dichanthelium oligosanthes]|uniref:Putative ADP-ribosylation factor GTPase-activating protein AGD5 n=1 Tax=Dichanthelium oligosanthes TaxID=888268 RepID=A0A1E5VPQ7_9POAL|nr:putative ADP-ribosylation factor GTPase-activating protein AGD5 [Dichanthelium oligosanthes]
MNEKASVSKELNAKHKKILEGLLRLPENRECADCKSKGPRWASVNLGIFVCMTCSGIHRSLGVHISKVRSATLDTWLPEQVAFIQSMGNEKANSYWEAELPPNYDRVGIENFIRAKYEDKRWVPRNGTSRPSSGTRDEKSQESPASANRSGHGHRSSFEQNRASPAPSKTAPVASRMPSQASPPKVEPPVAKVVSPPQPQKSPAKVEATPSKVEKPSVAPPPKVDYATDLFNMLSMDGTNEKESESSSNDDNAWDGFQSAQPVPSSEKKDSAKPAESKPQSTSGLEDLFKDSPAVSLSSAPAVSQVNAKNDIMSLFEKVSTSTPFTTLVMKNSSTHKRKGAFVFYLRNSYVLQSNMVSPFAAHQQQLAFMSQQQALLMAALKAGNAPQMVPGNVNQLNANGSNSPLGTLPFQNWTNLGYQNPGLTPAAAAQNGAAKVANNNQDFSSGNFGFGSPGLYNVSSPAPANGATTAAASNNGTASTASSTLPSQSGKDYDFSSLTQGFFSKR